MSGTAYHPIPSSCEEVSWSESSHTASTQDSIDSLQWSTDSTGCTGFSLFQDEAAQPLTDYHDSNLALISPVEKYPNTASSETENPLTNFGTVRDFQAYSPAPTLSPLKTGKKMLCYKSEAIQILLNNESSLSSTPEGAWFIDKVNSNSKLNGYRLDNVGWMFDTAQHLMQSELDTRKCCYYDVFQLAVALYDRYLSMLFSDEREYVYSFKVPAATCLCIASGVLNDKPFSPEELAETAKLTTIHIIHEEFKIAKKLGWEHSKLSTPMEFIECVIPALNLEETQRNKLLSLSSLKSCFCMYRPDFLDIPYSIIGFACILHTADSKFFKNSRQHIKDACYHLFQYSEPVLHSQNDTQSISPSLPQSGRQVDTLERAYFQLDQSTNEVINSSK